MYALVCVCVCFYQGASELRIYVNVWHPLLSAAERRGTPVLLSASVSDNSGNSPQMAAPRRSREIDQSTQRFHVGCDNRCLLGNEYGRLHGREFLGRT